jgi:gluconate 2-dehydrogenase gamma chain
MTKSKESRRDFLKSSGKVFGASWMAINMPLILSANQTALENKQAGAVFTNLSAADAIEISAIVDQIIPQDETPGATETGVVYFLDVALGGFMADALPVLGQGLEELQSKTKSAYPQVNRFSELPPELQTEMLRTIEDTPLFGFLHFSTMCGMFCLPAYGGNREQAGWNLIGFDHQHVWQPPFGYYDAAVHGMATDKEADHEHV